MFVAFILMLALVHFTVEQENPRFKSRWTTKLDFLNTFGSSGRNVARDVAVDKSGNTIVVGMFDSVVKIGKVTLSTGFPAAFIAKMSPTGEPLWALQSECDSRGSSVTHVSAYSVITSQKDESIVVGGAYAAARLFFHDFDNKDKKHEIQSIARQVSSFVLKLTADGKVEWLIGPTVFNMQYVTAVGIDDKNRVYAGGSFQGAVLFPNSRAELPNAHGVQGWLARFKQNGDLDSLTSLLGSGHNVVTDLVVDSTSNKVFVMGTFQSECTVNVVDSNNKQWYTQVLNGTTSRSVLLFAADVEHGAWHWFQTAGADDAVTCDEYHYVDVAQPATADTLYISGCFSVAMNFTTLPNNVTQNEIHSLQTDSSFNSIYIAKFNKNGTLMWTQAMISDNILDYSFALRSAAQVHIDATADGAVASRRSGGALVVAYAQGVWRVGQRTSSTVLPPVNATTSGAQSTWCGNASLSVSPQQRGYGGEYGAMYGAMFDEQGCLSWISLLAYGRAQSGGAIVVTPSRLALFGTFSGTVSFGLNAGDNATSAVGGRTADVFYALLDVHEIGMLPSDSFVHELWQYGVLGAFALLFAVALACIINMYASPYSRPSSRERDERRALLPTRRNRRHASASATTSTHSADVGSKSKHNHNSSNSLAPSTSIDKNNQNINNTNNSTNNNTNNSTTTTTSSSTTTTEHFDDAAVGLAFAAPSNDQHDHDDHDDNDDDLDDQDDQHDHDDLIVDQLPPKI